VTCPCPSVCYNKKRGWNLPPDTVTTIHRELRNGQPIAEFEVDSGKWTKTYTDFVGQVIHSNEELGRRGFIVVYAGCRAQKGDAQARAARAKEYIIRAHAIDSDQIKTIDGGQREEMLIELHIRARGLPAPRTSSSTYPPQHSRKH
jgi:hypothetical protein